MKVRRIWFALTVSLGALALLSTTARIVASDDDGATRHGWRGQRAKHVILFVGDGMHLQHEIATSRYLHGRNYWLSFHGFPYDANVSTWDVTTYNKYAGASAPPYGPVSFDPLLGYDPARGGARPYPLAAVPESNYFIPPFDPATGKWPKPFATDSGSAATAWATGVKTDDGNLAWKPGDFPDGRLTTIAELARAKGMAIGVVSTVPFTHATPAAHVSHNTSRNNYFAIADEIVRDVKPDVVIGGGHPLYAYRTKPDGSYQDGVYMSRALLEDVRNGQLPGYVLVERQAGVDGTWALRKAAARVSLARGERLLGLFGGSGGNFESPVPADRPGRPSVVRGSAENPWLKDATLAALNVLSQDDDGFFVMIEQGDIDWANHANDFQQMVGTTFDLDEAIKAAMAFVMRPGDDVTWANTLMIVTADHSNSYMRIEKPLGKGDLPTQEPGPAGGCPPEFCGAFVYPGGEITYATGDHTNELVRLYAVGGDAHLFRRHEGTWYPGTKIIDNTHIFDVMKKALGIK